jgi:cytochrome b
MLKVWDIPTRIFHWTLVTLIVAAWITSEFGWMEWHAWVGQTVLALVIYRVFWGIVGSETAQFGNFIKGPAAVLAYARSLVGGAPIPPSVGHNPLGALMIRALLGLVALQATLGLFSNDDIVFDGPLTHLVDKATSDSLTGWHETVFNLILLAAAIHIAAAIYYLLFKGENLIGAMITGAKDWQQPHPKLRFTPAWVALPVLAAAAALVWAAVTYL